GLFGVFDGGDEPRMHTGVCLVDLLLFVLCPWLPTPGHSGKAAADFCRTHMLDYVRRQLKASPTDVPEALRTAFLSLDKDFLSEALRTRRFADGISGACAIVAHVSADGVLHVANAGDCRAVLSIGIEREASHASENADAAEQPSKASKLA